MQNFSDAQRHVSRHAFLWLFTQTRNGPRNVRLVHVSPR